MKIKLTKKFRQCKFTVLQAEEWSSRSRTTVVNMSANASDRLAKMALEKAIVHKNLGQYFIFMVTSVAASSSMPLEVLSFTE